MQYIVPYCSVYVQCSCLSGIVCICIHVPPEAAHFSLKRGKWVVSGVVMLYCLTTFLISSNIHVYTSTCASEYLSVRLCVIHHCVHMEIHL